MFQLAASRTAAAVFALFFAPVAFAHVTLETPQGASESHYKAVLKVPHGCKGSPTVKLRVRIPEGVISAKPQPKPGWKLETIKGDYAKTYSLYGAQITSGVQEIVWSGGSLPDDQYDEFVFSAYLSSALKPGSTVYLPVVQECSKGVERWIDLPDPKASSDAAHAGSPAPGLKILPKP